MRVLKEQECSLISAGNKDAEYMLGGLGIGLSAGFLAGMVIADMYLEDSFVNAWAYVCGVLFLGGAIGSHVISRYKYSDL